MKILSAQQIRDLDAGTIASQQITSHDLMEKAAHALFVWIIKKFSKRNRFHIICGAGNNGGDGLALARFLIQKGYNTKVYIPDFVQNFSKDNLDNQKRLAKLKININRISANHKFPKGIRNVIVDGLLGTGLNRDTDGAMASLIQNINLHPGAKLAIDIPSGMFADKPIATDNVFRANFTVSFQIPKLAFMFPESGQYTGEWHLVDIGLSKKLIATLECKYTYVQTAEIQKIYRRRTQFSHKGTFGHALIIAGSYGKIGAAILSAQASLRTGSGLTTVFTPKCGYEILQSSVPESMVLSDENDNYITNFPEINAFDSIGIGPGIGIETSTIKAFKTFLNNNESLKNLVLDADALNLLSMDKHLLNNLPQNTILTPHIKEFERLTGKTENDFDRLNKQIDFSCKYRVIVILKGKHSCITFPDGKVFFNSTGNPGMATAGSGDVLTGIITGLMAQKYSPENAAIFGVFLHGLAGDFAAKKKSQESMTASDIIAFLGQSYLLLKAGIQN